MKPFKPPSLVGKNTLNGRPPPSFDEEPPTKKRRYSDGESNDDNAEVVAAAVKVLKKPKSIPKFQPLLQKPVNTVANSQNSSQGSEEKSSSSQEGYYTVLWYVCLGSNLSRLMLIHPQAQIHNQEEQDLGRRWHPLSIRWLCATPGCVRPRPRQVCIQIASY